MRAALILALRLVVTLALSASPALAERWIDGPLLLKENADLVTLKTESDGLVLQSIDFGNGIVIVCTHGECAGWDTGGPTACLWTIVTDLQILDAMCGFASAEQAAALQSVHLRVAAHVAANAVPPREVSELDDDFRQRLAAGLPVTEHGKQAICNWLLQPEHKSVSVLEELLSPASGQKIEAMLAEPRLPISNPCPWSLWWR